MDEMSEFYFKLGVESAMKEASILRAFRRTDKPEEKTRNTETKKEKEYVCCKSEKTGDGN